MDRISERNRIKGEQRERESFLKFNTNAILRLRKSQCDVDFNRKKIASLKKENEKFSNDIKLLDERLVLLNSGKLDDELKSDRRAQTAVGQKKALEKRQKKLAEIEDKKARSVMSMAYYKRTAKACREARYDVRSAARGYDYVLRVHKSLPQYIRAKLASMPNNKGYIWRGVHYYGEKNPENNGDNVMFENKKGVLHIHAWSRGNMKYTLTTKQKQDKYGKIEFVEHFYRDASGKRISKGREKPTQILHSTIKKRNHRVRKLTPSEARKRSRGGGGNNTRPTKTQGGRGRVQGGRGRVQGGRGRVQGGRGRVQGGRGRAQGGRGRVQGGRGRVQGGRGRVQGGRGRVQGGRGRSKANRQVKKEEQGGRGVNGSCSARLPGRGRGRSQTIPAWMAKKNKITA